VVFAERDDAVDVLDAALGELRGIGEDRDAAREQRALGERRAVMRQSRPDQRHGDAVLGQACGARIAGDTVADDDDPLAHAFSRA